IRLDRCQLGVAAGVLSLTRFLPGHAAAATKSINVDLIGQAIAAGAPIVGSVVTLWEGSAAAPRQIAQTRTDDAGRFVFAGVDAPGPNAIRYVVAAGGMPTANAAAGEQPTLALMTLLGPTPPPFVTINELTTVAAAFAAARFIANGTIAGPPLGLRIAAGNAPNLVDPATGGWGAVLLDPLNSTQTTTLATLNTLADLIAASAAFANDDWRARFFQAAAPPGGAAPKNTLEAMAGIARAPWAHAKDLYALFDEAYPQPANGSRRAARFPPYLAYEPPDFALSLCFAGGGLFAPGKFVFDADGNLWSGQNWMPGSQSGVVHNIGGSTVKFAPNGIALSPPITGFTGMGVDGIGWGTGVMLDKVWVTGLNGAIGIMDFAGQPIGQESAFPMAGKVGGLQGVGVAANGDVWITGATKNQMLSFPGGRVQDGRLVQVAGLKSPFAVVIDDQQRIWVSNAQSDTVVRFPADDPTKIESFRAGIAVRGIALDAQGNLWTASNMSPDFPPPAKLDGVSVMKQFHPAGQHLVQALPPGKTTGVVNMIAPDGTQPAPKGYDGGGKINVPWDVSIDGDDVWVANFWGRGVVLLAGAAPNGHPAGVKPGDVVHVFQSGSIQSLTDVAIDPVGNVWAANNWNNVPAALDNVPAWPTSTWGGGSGCTVIYGVAAPVQAPLMGHARKA
ncbi:MAG TPA: hypothetical protein VFU81_01920, partial [Thermomicrobiales bacterium]|nr:hypothetical protein [Thermomicrobiales bacterium]